jgi:dTDP-L-rhamnose 4-epimerase
VYAITKRDHEELFVTVGRAYGVPTVALRYFNVYGPRQSLANPYTGVAAIFSSRLLNGEPPLIFEDGKQSRDFIHVSDVVRANLLALEKPEADGQVFNVGTGRSLNLLRLGFEAKLPFEDGVEDLAAWAREQAPMDVADRAQAELRATGLTQ